MKIILTYPDDLGEEIEGEIIEWMEEKVASCKESSPLRYAVNVEVEK